MPAHALPDRAVRWMVSCLGGASEIGAVRVLPGGTSTAVHAVDVRTASHTVRPLVIKRFTNRAWLLDEPGLVVKEATAMDVLEAIELPVPRHLASDPVGVHCDVPAVLMERMPGRIVVQPARSEPWLRALAGVLVLLHGSAGRLPLERLQLYRPYQPDPLALEPPGWSTQPKAWKAALRVVAARPPEEREVMIHRDYHPLNVLWEEDRVSAVVDWTNASRGPAAIDLAHCRINLAQMHGLAEADRFLSFYRSSTGEDLHPYWDLRVAVDCLPCESDESGWRALGLHHCTPAVTRGQLDAFVAAALDRL